MAAARGGAAARAFVPIAPRVVACVLACGVFAAACAKDKAKPVAEEPAPAAPTEVLAQSVPVLVQAELPSAQGLGSAGAVVDAVSPGASSLAGSAIPGLLASMVQMPSLDGVRLDQPVRVMVLDPKQHPEPAVLLVSVADEATLAGTAGKERLVVQDGLALIGAPGAIAAARAYALDTLARRPAPDQPRVTAFVQPALAIFRDEIAQARAQMSAMMTLLAQSQGSGPDLSKLMGLYADSLLAVVAQTETVEVTLASHGGFAGAALVLRPLPDSGFAGFNSAQAASDLALLDKLPPGDNLAMIMAGRLVAGPAREAVRVLTKDMMDELLGEAVGRETQAAMDGWMDLFEGEFAGWMASSPAEGMGMAYLMAVSDGAKAAEYTNQMAAIMAAQPGGVQVMGMKQTTTHRANALTHDGVSVTEQHAVIDLDTVPAEQREAMERMGTANTFSYLAGYDTYMAMAMRTPDIMRAMIDSSRGKAPGLSLSGLLARARDAALARKDSVLMFMDMGALTAGSPAPMPPGMPQGILMSLGFTGGNASLFVAVPGADR